MLVSAVGVWSAHAAVREHQGAVPFNGSYIGPVRLVSPTFGYAAVQQDGKRLALFVYRSGRWRNVTPARLLGQVIEDVAFIDTHHGWLASFDPGTLGVHLYRTVDGGGSWMPLGAPVTHSGGGGPALLSFADARNGWLETLEPTAPGGTLYRTTDGGGSWSVVASAGDGGAGKGNFPCLAPMALTTATTGWMGRAGDYNPPLCDSHAFVSHNGGRTWSTSHIAYPQGLGTPTVDLPRFFGRSGVVPVTLGQRRAHAVSFAVSNDEGRTWSVRATRPVASCPMRLDGAHFHEFDAAFWPASVANKRVWWIVSGHTVQITRDSGRHWQTITARGLPARRWRTARAKMAISMCCTTSPETEKPL